MRWAIVRWAIMRWAIARWAIVRWAIVHWAIVRWAIARWAIVCWAIALLSPLLKLNSFFRLALFSPGLHHQLFSPGLHQQLYVNYAVPERCNLPFVLSRTFETLFRKPSILSKIWK